MDFDYLSIINHLILSKEFTELFDAVETGYSETTKMLQNELLEILPKDKHDLFFKFMKALNNHLVEIRNNDCSKAFYEGMKFGMGYEQFINDLANKNILDSKHL